MPTFTDQAVAETFAAFPDHLRPRLLAIRTMIFDVAATTPGVGRVEEALRWGQPSYLTSETGSGSTIRLGLVKAEDRCCAMFVHCQSGLADTFKALYSNELTIEGNRSLVFSIDHPLPKAELRHCIGLALTHHLRKKTGRSR